MGDEDDIVETIRQEVAEAAKAVVADVKSIAHEVADAIAETVGEHPQHIRPASDDKSAPSGTTDGGDASRGNDVTDS